MKKPDNNLKTLGVYEIIGGIIGLLILLTINIEYLNSANITSLVISLILYVFSIYCGYLLLNGELQKGINLSIYNNLIQIVGFGVLGFVFKFTSGICLGINLDMTNDTLLRLNFDISNLHINIKGSSEITFISFNFLSMFIVRYLLKMKEILILKKI